MFIIYLLTLFFLFFFLIVALVCGDGIGDIYPMAALHALKYEIKIY